MQDIYAPSMWKHPCKILHTVHRIHSTTLCTTARTTLHYIHHATPQYTSHRRTHCITHTLHPLHYTPEHALHYTHCITALHASTRTALHSLHYTPLHALHCIHCITRLYTHCTASSALHASTRTAPTALHAIIHALHCIHCIARHYTRTALYPLHYTPLYTHCTASTALHASTRTALHPLHYTPLYMHCTVSTALHAIIHALHCIHCIARHYTRITLHPLHCTPLAPLSLPSHAPSCYVPCIIFYPLHCVCLTASLTFCLHLGLVCPVIMHDHSSHVSQ